MRFVFLDFEASGLHRDSWPIEVGLAWIADGAIRVEASLIRPDPDWPIAAWSAESAAVHGIPLAELATAPPAGAVAGRFAALMSDALVLSDAPEFDQRWLDRLLATLPEPPAIILRDFDAETHGAFTAHALDAVYEQLNLIRAPHRAGPDAARLAKAWLAGSRR
ncbi:exonuclease domain-containing protein [Rubrimonas cliftonensis]|uniref:Exonuclease n=1 Tax=Rubrimonas cliftonensis TaxID=89524 RepID=A0A1H4FGA6_9RHOB|nr:exonuclease domain-containing protein [Rubrimonas cliftonensis]SEA96354.1 Exonuclease [Rubrimonas cliftonensis]